MVIVTQRSKVLL